MYVCLCMYMISTNFISLKSSFVSKTCTANTSFI